MPEQPKRKRVTKRWLETLTDEEKVARRRAKDTRAKRKRRQAMTPAERRALWVEQSQKCFELDRLMAHVQKESEDGCWIWTGSYRRVWEDVRPRIRAGEYGDGHADVCLYVAVTGKKISMTCYIARTCGRNECVAPHHARFTNQLVERAIGRINNGQEEQQQLRDGSGSGDPVRGGTDLRGPVSCGEGRAPAARRAG